MKASRFSRSDGMPAEMVMSVRQVTSGSRLTSVAARSALSSAARNHSSSARRTANSGSPAITPNGVRAPRRSRICSAVM
jgi:hypothetical protein